jgi:hypothetical protein
LDRTVRLLKAALAEPELSLSHAIHLVDNHIRRNTIAKASHDKTLLAKHKDEKFAAAEELGAKVIHPAFGLCVPARLRGA